MENLFKTSMKRSSNSPKGFTLLEMVITVSIMGILAAVVSPTYFNLQNEAKLVTSEHNLGQIKQGLINLYLEGILDQEYDVWPAEPTDHKMTQTWANETLLGNGRSVSQLFSGSEIINNPYDNPYLYYLLPETETESAGFRIDDPDTGLSQSFRP